LTQELITDTPATSCGYWKARNSPDLPRSSADHSFISSPRNLIVPSVISYSGLPRRTAAKVDFPDPLGPIKA